MKEGSGAAQGLHRNQRGVTPIKLAIILFVVVVVGIVVFIILAMSGLLASDGTMELTPADTVVEPVDQEIDMSELLPGVTTFVSTLRIYPQQ